MWKDAKIRVPSKYISNLWVTLEMSLINCEVSFILSWSVRCFIIDAPIASQEPTFTIIDTKLYVLAIEIERINN